MQRGHHQGDHIVEQDGQAPLCIRIRIGNTHNNREDIAMGGIL